MKLNYLIKFGNHKIGKDTMIFNMSTATACPSKRLGLCKVVNNKTRCYAFKAEQQYKDNVLNYRENQSKYWKEKTAEEIIADIKNIISKKKSPVKYFRFNESGDFEEQKDISKLSTISESIKHEFNITTYGYTARSDLNFKDCKFLVKGSGWYGPGLTGSTVVINNKSELPENYILCPGEKNSCASCDLCKTETKTNIAFIKH